MKKKVLVLCTGNSCRSQMAHGYLESLAGAGLEVFSAGLEAKGLDPRAVAVMKDDGVDISRNTSNVVSEYRDIEFDFVLTVCDNASEKCPLFPARVQRLHQNFSDPARLPGSDDSVMNEFRYVRDQIRDYISDFVKRYVNVSS